MKIQSLQLKNFRCFNNEIIRFHDKLTVLVGVNGSGKTALIEAVAMILGDIVRYAVSNEVLRYNLEHKDTTFSSKENVSIKANFSAFNNIFSWYDPVVEESKEGFVKTKIVNYGKNSNPYFINMLISLQDVYPVIAYYSSHRLLGNAVSSGERNFDRNRLDAYVSCFEPEVDFNRIITWLDALDASEARSMRSGENNTDYRELKTLREAVNKSLPGYKDFRFINVPPEFALTRIKDGQIITFRQLSTGYRIMFALARRMAVANGGIFAQQGKSALESPAIVLIDEVELHLHPSWQQTVLPSLMEIFPNTQFIVTTHSPQVLTSIPSECIRILNDGKVYDAPAGSQGAESSRLLKRILGVDPRPPLDPVTKMLEVYKKLVYEDKWDSEEAKKLRHDLDDVFRGGRTCFDRIRFAHRQSQVGAWAVKRVRKSSEPKALEIYRQNIPGAKWESMRNDAEHGGDTAYSACRETAAQDQGHICAYCECKIQYRDPLSCRVEHFHDKSDISSAHN